MLLSATSNCNITFNSPALNQCHMGKQLMYSEELRCLTVLASDAMMQVETYYNLVQLCF
ncbi:hypothetical protein M8C21_020516 [Ambrosia artemisiifolia]|uniref:Uncharacterized protein n=1 Tax=Ambrosia artemisiifolia TaxID=4212 RepID=A0AAD5CZ88_AMBAR|nr:hypothetical protein M8C21_020516 [Ambrosia artemisiifolia]